MKMAKFLNKLTLPELEAIRLLANLNDEEDEVFSLLARGDSLVAIADRLNISVGTVSNRVYSIKQKIIKVVGVLE